MPGPLALGILHLRGLARDFADYRDDLLWEQEWAVELGVAFPIAVDPDLHEEGVGDQGLS